MLLEIWERGAAEHPLDRALTLIDLDQSTRPRSELATLPLAERDRRLFAVAKELLGPRIVVVCTCPFCDEETELSFTAEQIQDATDRETVCSIEFDGEQVFYRAPTSRDLAAALSSPGPNGARYALLAALIERDRPDHRLLDRLDAELSKRAGLEMLTLAHSCAKCGAASESPFDILDYLWRHVAARALRALWEVHFLARAYGWTSDEILSLSPTRRAAHIDMVMA